MKFLKNSLIFTLILILFSLVVLHLLAFQPGKEFQVNTYTKDIQRYPAVAMNEKGNFVITWESVGQDGSQDGIFAQRFNREGKAIGREFQVNTYNRGHQNLGAIAMDEKGNFVITWHSMFHNGFDPGIFAQRFNRKGKAIGSEFQVNTRTKGYQIRPAVAMDAKGNFVITWDSDGQDGSKRGIFAKMFKK